VLRPDDEAYLTRHGIAYELMSDPQGTHLILTDVALPPGLEPTTVDILITLPPGFNDVGPDMFWCYPPVSRGDGQGIPGTQVTHEFNGRTWQRWSRHIGGDWRPGIDNVATYIAYVKRALLDVVKRAA
jgi:hypothetical protein